MKYLKRWHSAKEEHMFTDFAWHPGTLTIKGGMTRRTRLMGRYIIRRPSTTTTHNYDAS